MAQRNPAVSPVEHVTPTFFAGFWYITSGWPDFWTINSIKEIIPKDDWAELWKLRGDSDFEHLWFSGSTLPFAKLTWLAGTLLNMDPDWRCIFPIEHGDVFFQLAMWPVYWGVKCGGAFLLKLSARPGYFRYLEKGRFFVGDFWHTRSEDPGRILSWRKGGRQASYKDHEKPRWGGPFQWNDW